MVWLDKTLLVLTALLAKPFYLLVRYLVLLAQWSPLLLPWCWACLHFENLRSHQAWQWTLGALFALNAFGVAAQPGSPGYRGNPAYPGMSGFFNFLIDRFINWIGVLKYFSFDVAGGRLSLPYSVVEDPGGYRLNAKVIRLLTEGGVEAADLPLQAGDILLRGYDHFVDGKFINLAGSDGSGADFFSHAALYVGELNEADRAQAASGLKVADGQGGWRAASPDEQQAVRCDEHYFQTGKQMVVHSMSRGVFVEDILTFTRCDYLAVIRLDEMVKLPAGSHGAARLKGEGGLTTEEEDIDRRLNAGEAVSRADIIRAARAVAISRIGSGYDFQFDDVRSFHRFSCSEFVYFCYKSVHRAVGLQLQRHAILKWFFARESITPPDIYTAARDGRSIRIIWRG